MACSCSFGGEGLWSIAEEAFLPRGAFGVDRSGLLSAALFEAVAVGVHLQDVDVVGDAVEQGAGEPLGAEDLGPFVERQVAGDERRGAFVTLA